MIRKALIVCFVFFNSVMVVYTNRPECVRRAARSYFDAHWDSAQVRNVDWLAFYVSWYPYLSGTDLIAKMFSTLSRGQWRFLITGVEVDGGEKTLRLPLQSPRTLIERALFDHKEGKVWNNLVGDERGRERYAAYLCRAASPERPRRYRSIRFVIFKRAFLSRAEALRLGRHFDEPELPYLLGEYSCERAE